MDFLILSKDKTTIYYKATRCLSTAKTVRPLNL